MSTSLLVLVKEGAMGLRWISDERLVDICKQLFCADGAKKASSNLIDPFSMEIDIASSGFSSIEDWEKMEKRRQNQKTMQNNVGLFHEKVLSSVAGWRKNKMGVDIEDESRLIVAELKNKYNTVKGSDLKSTYSELDTALKDRFNSTGKQYLGYYVRIIDRNIGDSPFTPTNNDKGGQKEAYNPFIRKIDGTSFYGLVTGDKDALYNLYKELPAVLHEIFPGFPYSNIVNSPKFKEFFGLINVRKAPSDPVAVRDNIPVFSKKYGYGIVKGITCESFTVEYGYSGSSNVVRAYPISPSARPKYNDRLFCENLKDMILVND